MSYLGTVKDGHLELDEPIHLASGTRVEVNLEAVVRPDVGSAKALLEIAGRLPADEADAILAAAQACRGVEPKLWA